MESKNKRGRCIKIQDWDQCNGMNDIYSSPMSPKDPNNGLDWFLAYVNQLGCHLDLPLGLISIGRSNHIKINTYEASKTFDPK
jgi:hypothetical protein